LGFTGPATVVRIAIYVSIDLNHGMIILMLAMAHDPGRRIMRVIALVSLLSATLLLCSGAARAAPWCAQYGGGDKGGGTNCGFYSFEQCMAAISGNGGFCTKNQFENPYWGGRPAQRRYRGGN
jgi:Protein of unknown function (DUF3551)